MTTRTRYPLEPLAQALGITLHAIGGQQPDQPPEGHTALAEALAVSRERIKQVAQHGLTPLCADRYAIRIGRHPSSLWPTWYDDAPEEGDDWYADDPPMTQLDLETAS